MEDISHHKEPGGFVDIHTHVVPGVDDGARDPNEARRLLEGARESGTRILVATPHLYPGTGVKPSLEAVLDARDQWLETASKRFPDLSLLPGAEIHCTHGLREALGRYGRRLTLNGGDYFLLEFPFDMLFPAVDELIFDLQQEGWIPVIAHPERNEVIQRHPEILYRMVSAGALAQLNAGSFTGRFGAASQRSAAVILRHNLAHIVASDAHWPLERPADLSGVENAMKELKLGEADPLIRENPDRLLRNLGMNRWADPLDPGESAGGFRKLLKGLIQR